MRNSLAFFLVLSFCAFAIEKYGVYDLQGNRVYTFEAESHELPEKIRQAKVNEPKKSLYVSSLKKKGIGSKSGSRYKAETGSYIEATRNETFSLCPPDKKTEGTWVSEHSVALDEKNCLSVQTPNLAGTFRILFMENSGLIDTIQVLVDQSYIQMGDYSHKVYIIDTAKIKDEKRPGIKVIYPGVAPGKYENKKYSQPLIVDKTKFTTGDAWYYYSKREPKYNSNNKIVQFLSDIELGKYQKNEKFEDSKLPFVGGWGYINDRSKSEGLDTAYIRVNPRSKIAKKLILLGNPADKDYSSCASCTMLALDTSASGYRLPFYEEWYFLMRAGASTRYYWGDEDDSLTVSRYAWVRPNPKLKPVAQLQPNQFGLYDMLGIAYEWIVASGDDAKPICGRTYNAPECTLICSTYEGAVLSGTLNHHYSSFRLLRKTPKLHKLEKF